MSKLFAGKQLVKKDGSKVKAEQALKGKLVGLYFSAHWCGPCREFTPILKDFYNELIGSEKFEIVFMSLDNSDSDLQTYLKEAHGDWLHLPFGDDQIKYESQKQVKGIPALVVVKDDGTVISEDGRDEVQGQQKPPKQIFAAWKSKA